MPVASWLKGWNSAPQCAPPTGPQQRLGGPHAALQLGWARRPGSAEEIRVAAHTFHRETPLSSSDLAGAVETFSTPAGGLSAEGPHHALGRWGRRADHRLG